MNHKEQLTVKPGMVVFNRNMAFIKVTSISKKKNGKLRMLGRTLNDDGTFAEEHPFNPNKWEIL